MWGPKCEKVQKPWVLWLKHWILSMRVFDEELLVIVLLIPFY